MDSLECIIDCLEDCFYSLDNLKDYCKNKGTDYKEILSVIEKLELIHADLYNKLQADKEV